jgi:hypothetical protein
LAEHSASAGSRLADRTRTDTAADTCS